MDINQLTAIFCQIDDFCKQIERYQQEKLLPSPKQHKPRGPKGSLSDSEIMTILVFFQASGYRNFKRAFPI